MNYLELDPCTLRILMFGDERMDGLTPRSRSIGDLAKIVLLPTELGRIVAQCDPEEDLFHVEYCALPGDVPRAEVWLSPDWRESNTRRERVKASSAVDRITRDKQRGRIELVVSKLQAKGLTKDLNYLANISERILSSGVEGNQEILKVLGLLETIIGFRDEDKQQQENK